MIRAIRSDLDAQGNEEVAIWRAVPMTEHDSAHITRGLIPLTEEGLLHRLVLDSGPGGTGTAFDWNQIPAEALPVSLLAGGIGPDNLTRALDAGCLGVDLNSGVEYEPEAGAWAGRKDAAALHHAFRLIRSHSHRAPDSVHEGK